jgi:hypothetical protein
MVDTAYLNIFHQISVVYPKSAFKESIILVITTYVWQGF